MYRGPPQQVCLDKGYEHSEVMDSPPDMYS